MWRAWLGFENVLSIDKSIARRFAGVASPIGVPTSSPWGRPFIKGYWVRLGLVTWQEGLR